MISNIADLLRKLEPRDYIILVLLTPPVWMLYIGQQNMLVTQEKSHTKYEEQLKAQQIQIDALKNENTKLYNQVDFLLKKLIKSSFTILRTGMHFCHHTKKNQPSMPPIWLPIQPLIMTMDRRKEGRQKWL